MNEATKYTDNQIKSPERHQRKNKAMSFVVGVGIGAVSFLGIREGMDTAPRPSLGPVEERAVPSTDAVLAPNEERSIADATDEIKRSVELLRSGKDGAAIPILYGNRAVFRDKNGGSDTFSISRPIIMAKHTGQAIRDPNQFYYGALVEAPDNSTQVVFYDPAEYELSIEEMQAGGPDVLDLKTVQLKIEDNLLIGTVTNMAAGAVGKVPLARATYHQ